MTEPPCPLRARLALPDLTAESELAVAFKDGFPVNPGHTLIVPRRHVAGLFELTAAEQAAVWAPARGPSRARSARPSTP